MENRTKKLLTLAVILIITVVLITFYKIYILHAYSITLEIPCDPNTEMCFFYECDLNNDTSCLNSEVEYYKILKKNAASILKCKEKDYDCLNCKNNEKKCSITFCDPTIIKNNCSNL